MKYYSLILLSLIIFFCKNKKHNNKSNKNIAKNTEIDTICYGNYGGKRLYTYSYYFTENTIIRHKEYFDYTKGIEKTSNASSIENWNNLLSKIDITSYSKIKNGESITASCGRDTYITLKLKNGKIISIINAYNDKIWSEIQKELEKLKNQIDQTK